jgi:hypothetical protein
MDVPTQLHLDTAKDIKKLAIDTKKKTIARLGSSTLP